MRDPIDIDLDIEYETDDALLATDGVQKEWLPKSLIDYPDTEGPGDTCTITMPEWLAEEKGFI